MIKQCDCPDNSPAAKFQTMTYGKNQRVFTVSNKGEALKCTVCGNGKKGK